MTHEFDPMSTDIRAMVRCVQEFISENSIKELGELRVEVLLEAFEIKRSGNYGVYSCYAPTYRSNIPRATVQKLVVERATRRIPYRHRHRSRFGY